MLNNPNPVYSSNVHPYTINPQSSFANLPTTFANPNNNTLLTSFASQPQYLPVASNTNQFILPSSTQTSYLNQVPTTHINYQTSVVQPTPVYRPSQSIINTSIAAPQQVQYVTIPVTQVATAPPPVYQQEIVHQRTIVH